MVMRLPVALHLLRRKPQAVVRFPSLRFLGASALRDTRPEIKLLRWFVLCCSGALASGCWCFARSPGPFRGHAPTSSGRALVITLDNSMSQQSRGRWEDTLRWSAGQLDELSPGDKAALLVMEPEPVWLVPMTDDLARIRAALAEVKPGYDRTRYARPAAACRGDALAKRTPGTKILAWGRR